VGAHPSGTHLIAAGRRARAAAQLGAAQRQRRLDV